MRKAAILSTLILLLTPAIALAHPGHPGHNFTDGFLHPLTGVDHILAMLAVGIWSAQLARPALWRVPFAWLLLMITGGILAAFHVPLPMVESGILVSVLLMGLLVMFALQMRPWSAAFLIAPFALCHGYSHVVEMTPGASVAGYITGFLIATAILLGTGAFAGKYLAATRRAQWLKAAGGAIAAGAVLLAFA